MPVPEGLLQRRKEMLLIPKRPQRRAKWPPITKATFRRSIGLWPRLATGAMMQPGMSWGTYYAQSLALWKGLDLRRTVRLHRLWKDRKTRRPPPARPGKRRMHSHSKPGFHKKKMPTN
jgi:hypothetical protein